jgi:hypothetical protein
MAKRGKAEKSAARGERLSVALRENLKRRKAQARGRAAGPEPEADLAKAAADSESKTPDFRRNRGND